MKDLRDLVGVTCYIESEIDAQVIARFCLKCMAVELELHSVVDHIAGIDFKCLESCGHVKVYIGKEVRARLVVIVKRAAKTIGPEHKIKAKIPCGGLLPAQLLVGRSLHIALRQLVDIVGRNRIHKK